MTQQGTPSEDVSIDLTEQELGQESGAGTLTLNERFEILKNERRRFVLEYLSGAEGTVPLSTLADRIAAVENDTSVEDVTSSERKRVYVALYQFHLPKMDRMGVVEYDKDRGDVSLTTEGRSLYQQHETEQTPGGYLELFDVCACGLGALVLVGVVLTQAWFVGSVFLGVQTALLAVKTAARHGT